ncbi:hypothetical protein GCM10010297_59190 [Streptomyces malachitofuscus]|nr:hypothetical protein GCM10010297_59190 [Streptomyces malachitofuscus]
MVRAVRIPAGPISRDRAAIAPIGTRIRRFGKPAIVGYVAPGRARGVAAGWVPGSRRVEGYIRRTGALTWDVVL